MPIFPFEASLDEIFRNPGAYIDSVFSCLESEFLIMPKGAGFVEYPVFERGYEKNDHCYKRKSVYSQDVKSAC